MIARLVLLTLPGLAVETAPLSGRRFLLAAVHVLISRVA
jgi:hypothetical protein